MPAERNQVDVRLGAAEATALGENGIENSLLTGTPSEFNFLVYIFYLVGGVLDLN
jgi:hypothetical protein